MGLQQWLDQFCVLHEQARGGSLSKSDHPRYLAGRDELARALLKAQQIALQPGERPRSSLRAASALQITLQLPSGTLHTITRDIGSGGFSVRLASPPPLGAVVVFTLKLSAKESIEGKAKVVSLSPVSDTRRASFCFDGLTPEMVERIEMVVFDAIVTQLKG
jgi:hypothetical protein